MKVVQQIKVPQQSVNDQDVQVIEIFYKDGEAVTEGDLLIELETSKAVFTIEAEEDGYVKYYCKENEDVEINKVIIEIFDSQENKVEQLAKKNTALELIEDVNHETIFSVAAQALILQKSISKNIFKNLDFVDTETILEKIGTPQRPEFFASKKKDYHQPLAENQELYTVKKISNQKKTEIEYLSAVQISNLTSTVNIYVETENIFEFINPFSKYFKNSLLPVITFETARLLKKHTEFNAFFANNNIALYKNVNIGIAIDMDLGLKTVKIKNTNTLSLSEIENSIFNLSNKYLDKKLQVEELTNITFTITDLSAEGVSFFRPLVNKNNSAILAISANDQKLNRTTLSLTFDHRVTSGKNATIFLRELKDRLESYALKSKTQNKKSDIKCFKCMKDIEEDFNGVGFLKTTTANNTEKYICQTCYNGF